MSDGPTYQTSPSATASLEPPMERRDAERYKITFKLSVSTKNPGEGWLTVSPAVVQDISRTGALIATKQTLQPLQNVTVSIPTDPCPDGMNLPGLFVGPATVVRVETGEDGRQLGGLRFGDAISYNVEFAVFVDFLHTMAQSHSAA